MKPVVVIGSGLAGFNTVKALRKEAPELPIVMLTADDGRNYSKPMLSNGFAKGKSADELAMGSAVDTAEKFNLEVRPSTHVTAIDAAAKQITLDDDSQLDYDKLVLAVGADTWTPPLEGNAAEAVFSINNLTDYGHFRTALDGKKKVLIMGGGLIGCEFANDLANGGFEVELVEPQGRCLPLLVPEAASAAVEKGLRDLGVTFHFGPLAKQVDQGENGQLVTTLSDGSTVTSDIVLSAIGFRPNVELAKSAGLTITKGIQTDRYLRTSDPHIFALGDCAEVAGYWKPFVLPLMAASRALGKTLAGEETPAVYGIMPVTVKTPACPVVVMPPEPGTEGSWETEEDADGNVRGLFKLPNGELGGYVLTGGIVREKFELNKQLKPLMEKDA